MEKLAVNKNKITVPDQFGNYVEWYKIPSSVQQANAWLKRTGVQNVKFGTNRGQAVLRRVDNGKVVMQSSTFENICMFLMVSPWQHKLKLKRDWYMDEEMCLMRGMVEVLLDSTMTQKISSYSGGVKVK